MRMKAEFLATQTEEKAAQYVLDAENIGKFYKRFIESFDSPLKAERYVRSHSPLGFHERMSQQTLIHIEIQNKKQTTSPLLEWYLTLCHYRDKVEGVIGWLRPYAERLDTLSAAQISPREQAKVLAKWQAEVPPHAGYVVGCLRRLSGELLEELLKEIRLDARNAFSHIDYTINLDKGVLWYYVLGSEVVEWTREQLELNLSTMYVYQFALISEWVLTLYPLLI